MQSKLALPQPLCLSKLLSTLRRYALCGAPLRNLAHQTLDLPLCAQSIYITILPGQILTNISLKAEIALAEAKVEYTRFEIDLRNKPDWYVPKVNPVGKVR